MAERRFFSPLFILAVSLMILIGIGLPPALAAIQDHFSKQPIELRVSFDDFDTDSLPSFRFDPELPATSGDAQWIGTEDWFSHGFAAANPPDARLKDRPVILFVTYYSDPRDTIPHTPEVCYRQAGSVIESMEKVDLEVAGFDEPVTARLLDISQGPFRLAVLYVICHNGEIYHEREHVRLAMGMPGDKYTYFSKIEAISQVDTKTTWEDAVVLTRQLLTESLEEMVDRHYPTRAQVAGEAPVAPAGS